MECHGGRDAVKSKVNAPRTRACNEMDESERKIVAERRLRPNWEHGPQSSESRRGIIERGFVVAERRSGET